jgi:hypothetical protein
MIDVLLSAAMKKGAALLRDDPQYTTLCQRPKPINHQQEINQRKAGQWIKIRMIPSYLPQINPHV